MDDKYQKKTNDALLVRVMQLSLRCGRTPTTI